MSSISPAVTQPLASESVASRAWSSIPYRSSGRPSQPSTVLRDTSILSAMARLGHPPAT